MNPLIQQKQRSPVQSKNREMKTRGFVVTLFTVAFVIAFQFLRPPIAAPASSANQSGG
jgi:hypothetical protein